MESEYERLRKKVENYPSASAYNRLAELARLNGNVQDAEQICQRCIKEFPRNGQAYVILAEISLAAGRREDAITLLENAAERDPRSYSAHRMLSDIYAEMGRIPKALQHLKLILTFKPNDNMVVQRIDLLSKDNSGAVRIADADVKKAQQTPVERLGQKPPPAATRDAALVSLIAENGVRGVVVGDAQGRVVVSQGIGAEKADVLAALASQVTKGCGSALSAVGADGLASWLVEGDKGQVLGFRRDDALTLAVLTAPGVRPALIELRARQVLLDIGAQ